MPLGEFNIVEALEFIKNRIIGNLKNPINFLFNGTKGHLWFLSSLIQVILITFFCEKYKLKISIFYFAIPLFVIGNLAFSYSNTLFGLNLNFNTRNGPFFGMLFFVSGFKLFQIDYNINYFKVGLVLSFIGFCIHFLELFVLYKYFDTVPLSDYVFGTYFFGIGVALIALSNNKIFRVPNLSSIGRKTLGVYGIHYIFIDILKPCKMQYCGTFVEIVFTLLVFGLSILTVYLMSFNRGLRKIVE